MSRRMLRSRCSKEGKSLCHMLYNVTRGSYLFGMDVTNEFGGIFQSSVHRIFQRHCYRLKRYKSESYIGSPSVGLIKCQS